MPSLITTETQANFKLVNFNKAVRLQPPLFKLLGFPGFEPPHFRRARHDITDEKDSNFSLCHILPNFDTSYTCYSD